VAEAVRADVTDELDVERLFSEAVDSCGGIDAVVQAVIGGLSSSRTLSEVGLEEFTTLTRGGARASFLVNREAARHVREGGAIVNLTSVAVSRRAHTPQPKLLAGRPSTH
jgi:3-oxoacyl-[acyl-carrier protein] reductase